MKYLSNLSQLLISFIFILLILPCTNLFAGAAVSFNDADYLVVVHTDLYSSGWASTLVDLKDDQDLSVGFKLIEDEESINDIKSYISTAYNTGNKPQYLLIIGDACNFDSEDRDYANAEEGNYIPTYYEDYPSNVNLTGEYSRDDWYGCLVSDFNEVRGYSVDYFPELYVGRIPAQNLTEINTYIDKLESYSSIATGEWRDDILFLSADVDNAGNGCKGSIVEHMTETVADYLIYDAWEKSYLWMSDYSTPAARESAFESAINSGAMIINAFGTGAHWKNLVEFYFDDSDYSFDNEGELGFLVGASCNIGDFHAYDDVSGEESPVVVEKLLFNSNGIIAAFVPASATIQEGNGKIAEHLYNRIFKNTIIRLGPAITAAKRDLTSTATKFIFMGKSFNLLGDPAMDLAWPYSEVNYQSRISCDNKFEFYLNNKLMSAGDNWQNAEFSQIDFEHGENVIAIKGIDQGGVAGLLVDINLPINKQLISDETWKCDTEYTKYWTSPRPRFKESGWIYATEYGQYGVSPWYSNVSGMGSTGAKWIWSDDRYNDNTVYFRKNLFWDDFDNNLRYKAWLTQGGDWNLENEEFSVEYTSGHNFNFAEYLSLDLDDLLSDLEFTVDINKKTSTQFQPGIAFRVTDKNNGYIFMVNGYGSKDWIQIYKVVNGSYYTIGPNSYWDDADDRLNLNTWYTLKIVVQGDSIKGKVWEKSQQEPGNWNNAVADNTYDYGKVGLHYCNAHLHFDNVYFTNIAAAPEEKFKNTIVYTSYPVTMDKDSLDKYVNGNGTKENELAGSFFLMDNYPDPFNPKTTISFNLPEKKRVKLIVYDIQGKVVRKLVDGYLDAGKHKVEFNANHLSSGIYFYRLDTGKESRIKKMTLIK